MGVPAKAFSFSNLPVADHGLIPCESCVMRSFTCYGLVALGAIFPQAFRLGKRSTTTSGVFVSREAGIDSTRLYSALLGSTRLYMQQNANESAGMPIPAQRSWMRHPREARRGVGQHLWV
jgi:hypothetical protein